MTDPLTLPRNLLYRPAAAIVTVALAPVWLVLYVAVKLDSPGPFIFKQKRAGKGRKPFIMFKIRTMEADAWQKQQVLFRKNEADGPVFKIRNDPRFTRVGRFLSHSGLDELPQLWNVVLGDMSVVGPRPLPVEEAQRVPAKYSQRFSVLPGMTSEWIVNGSHKLRFDEWMLLDLAYVSHRSFSCDMRILMQTVKIVFGFLLKR